MECIGYRVTKTPEHLFHRDYWEAYRIRLCPNRINITRLPLQTSGAIIFKITKRVEDMTGQAHFYGRTAYGYLMDDHTRLIHTGNVKDHRPVQAILCTHDGRPLPEMSDTEFAITPSADKFIGLRVSYDTYHTVDVDHHVALTPDVRTCDPSMSDDMIFTLATNCRDFDSERGVLLKITKKYREVDKAPNTSTQKVTPKTPSTSVRRRAYLVDGRRLTPKIIAPPTHRLAGKLLYSLTGNGEISPPPQQGELKRYKLSPYDIVMPGHVFSLAEGAVRILVVKIVEHNKVDAYELTPPGTTGTLTPNART